MGMGLRGYMCGRAYTWIYVCVYVFMYICIYIYIYYLACGNNPFLLSPQLPLLHEHQILTLSQ